MKQAFAYDHQGTTYVLVLVGGEKEIQNHGSRLGLSPVLMPCTTDEARTLRYRDGLGHTFSVYACGTEPQLRAHAERLQLTYEGHLLEPT